MEGILHKPRACLQIAKAGRIEKSGRATKESNIKCQRQGRNSAMSLASNCGSFAFCSRLHNWFKTLSTSRRMTRTKIKPWQKTFSQLIKHLQPTCLHDNFKFQKLNTTKSHCSTRVFKATCRLCFRWSKHHRGKGIMLRCVISCGVSDDSLVFTRYCSIVLDDNICSIELSELS